MVPFFTKPNKSEPNCSPSQKEKRKRKEREGFLHQKGEGKSGDRTSLFSSHHFYLRVKERKRKRAGRARYPWDSLGSKQRCERKNEETLPGKLPLMDEMLSSFKNGGNTLKQKAEEYSQAENKYYLP